MQFSKFSFKAVVLVLLGIVSVALAQDEEPGVERNVVSLDPLRFYVDGSAVSDESENQRLWNELMKYKLWGTDSVVFNKNGFRAADPNGYTGTATGNIIFRSGGHTLGGPIVSGNDIEISYPGYGADRDTLLVGPVRAGWLVLPGWFGENNGKDVEYQGIYCFEHQIYFDSPDRANNVDGSTKTAQYFISQVHKSGGKIYADWDKDMLVPGTSDVIVPGLPDISSALKDVNAEGVNDVWLDGSFADCPKDKVPEPEKKLSVPLIENITNWGPAIDVSSNSGKIVFVHVPPITKEDLNQSPKKVWYDKYVENIKAGGSKGEIIYILMPSSKHNANRKSGRLTRIFSRDGFNFQNFANNLRIQVAIVNDNATWNNSTQMWENLNEPEYYSNGKTIESEDKPYWIENDGNGNDVWYNLDKLNITPVADSNYAGNLLFYTTALVEWKPFIGTDGDKSAGAKFQGTFITTGDFLIADRISVAGQLIAGQKLKFESDFNGEFHYVPFNAAEIKADIFSSDKFKESETVWYDMNFYLTDTARTDVTFDYCLAFFGIDLDVPASLQGRSFAEPEDLDLDDKTHPMPLCSKGEKRTVVISKNSRTPDTTIVGNMPYIKVKLDGEFENDEYMLFKITNLNGATITGSRFDGGLLVKLIDDCNEPPHFIDVDKVKLAVVENKSQATAGQVKAEDKEGNLFVFDIVGGSAQNLFDIDPTTGIVSMKDDVEPFDYEEWKTSGKKLTLLVEVCDQKAATSGVLLCTRQNFTVSVIDDNEKPKFKESSYAYSIAEDINVDETNLLGSVAAEDQDAESTITYSLEGDEAALFNINAGTGEIFIRDGTSFDYETKSSYTFEVVASDEILEDRVSVTVNITDVNEKPIFIQPAKKLAFKENEPKGYEIGVLTFDELDTIAKFRNNMLECLNCRRLGFNLDENTGVLTTTKRFDYETDASTYKLNVVVYDASGDESLTDSGTVYVELLNVDNPAIGDSSMVLSAVFFDWAGESYHDSIDIDFGHTHGGNSYTKVGLDSTCNSGDKIKGMVQQTLVNGRPARVDSTNFPWNKCAAGHEIDKWFVPQVIANVGGKEYTNSTKKNIKLQLDEEGDWYANYMNESGDCNDPVNPGFFPLDDFEYLDSAKTIKNPKFDWNVEGYVNHGDGWKLDTCKHNYSYSMMVSASFKYVKGQYFEFLGDDDVWVFINNKLVVDIGGIHEKVEGAVDLDTLNLTEGREYPFHIFYAERNATGSNLAMRTSITFIEGNSSSSSAIAKSSSSSRKPVSSSSSKPASSSSKKNVVSSSSSSARPASSSSSSYRPVASSSSIMVASSSSQFVIEPESSASSSDSNTSEYAYPTFHVRMVAPFEFEIVMFESLPSLAKQYAVMDMKGQVLSVGELNSKETRVKVPTRGAYVVRVGLGYKRVNVK